VRVLLPSAVSVALVALAACSSFGSATAVDETVDAGLDAPFGVDAIGAGMDAAPPDGGATSPCTTLVSDAFATQRPEWQGTGQDQRFDPGELVLTPGGASKNGAVWWNKQLTYEGFLRVRVELRTATALGALKGNGFALTWATASSPLPATIGGLGESFGVCTSTPPVQGYAVTGSTGFERIAIVDTVGCDTNPAGDRPAAMLDGDHVFSFEVRPAKITASLDGMLMLSRTALSPAAAKVGYFGMSAAAAGTGTTSHVIKRVVIESCTE